MLYVANFAFLKFNDTDDIRLIMDMIHIYEKNLVNGNI